MGGTTQPGTPGTTTSSAPPWWSHVVIGVTVIAAGFGLLIYSHVANDPTTGVAGVAMVGSGVTFLGVGSGVAASS